MGKKPDRLCRTAIQTAMEFFNERFWEIYEPDGVVVFSIPGQTDPYFAMLMGDNGEEFGLSILFGSDAFENTVNLIDSNNYSLAELGDRTSTMGFSISPLFEIPPPLRSVLNRAKHSARRESLVPCFLTKKAYENTRIMSDPELKITSAITRALIHAHRQDVLEFRSPLDSESLQEIHINDLSDPEILDFSIYAVKNLSPQVIELEPPPAILSKLKKKKDELLISFRRVPFIVGNTPESISVLLVYNISRDKLFSAKPLPSGNSEDAVKEVYQILAGKNDEKWKGLPSVTIFSESTLMHRIAPHLESFGVETTFEPDNPITEELLESFQSYMDEFDTFGNLDEMPEPDDLEAWMFFHLDIVSTLTTLVYDETIESDKIIERFFGAPTILSDLAVIHPEQHLMESFLNWIVFDLNVTDNSPAMAQLKMEIDTSQPHVIEHIQRMMDAVPSIYRIEKIERAGLLVRVRDIFTDEVRSVVLPEFARKQDRGIYISLRISQGGDFNFGSLAGAYFDERNKQKVIDFLHDQGYALPSNDKNHLLGQLWSILD